MHITSELGGQYGCQNNIYPHFSLDKIEQTCSFRLGTVAVVDFFSAAFFNHGLPLDQQWARMD